MNKENMQRETHEKLKSIHFIHHEVVPGIGWVPPDHILHPDNEQLIYRKEK
jgi:hypothetical protein